jgi:hypothetical protein
MRISCRASILNRQIQTDTEMHSDTYLITSEHNLTPLTEPHFERSNYEFHDGGRAAAGYKGLAHDCVCRAFAIATNRPYQEIYDLINELAKSERLTKRKPKRSSARTGVYKQTTRNLAKELGFRWVPTMAIGQGCKVHLRPEELPTGTLVVSVSKHVVAVIDGQIHDTHDPSREGTRCVYGYWELTQ